MVRSVNGLLLAGLLVLMSGCSDPSAESDSHVWKEQVETIDKARDLENTLRQASEAGLSQVETQSE